MTGRGQPGDDPMVVGDDPMVDDPVPFVVQTEPPQGMELRLSGVPTSLSADDLLMQLKNTYLHVDYTFQVVLEKSSEDMFWESFDNSGRGHTMSARVIIPNESGPNNVGSRLVAQQVIDIRDGSGASTRVSVTKVENPETTNRRFAKLRSIPLQLAPPQGIRDGVVGSLRQVSYGNFSSTDKFQGAEFETAFSWRYAADQVFGSLSYLGDARPPRFRICLTVSRLSGDDIMLEWMDLPETTIRGVVFEPSPASNQDQTRRVVYFVVDKPPRFYRRAHSAREGYSARTRIPYPSSLPLQQGGNSDLDVCNVPWPVQYCRVLKVEFRISQDFRPRSFGPRISQERKEPMFCFESALIATSGRQVDDMLGSLRRTLGRIASVTPPCTGCELGLTKLLYNCNLTATASTAADFLQQLIDIHATMDRRRCRLFTEGLNKMAQDTGTIHARVLRKLHRSAEAALANLPSSSLATAQPVLPPKPSAVDTGGWQNFAFKDFGKIFTNEYLKRQEEQQKQQGSTLSRGVFEAQVYPSHIELQGPIDPTVNSITEAYQANIDHFHRVKFVENDGKRLKPEAGISLDDVIDQRIVRVLTQQNRPLPPVRGLTGFDFLGYSMSGLKKRKAVWLFQATGDGLDARRIRDAIGDWDPNGQNRSLARHPSKWGARISLAFTEAFQVAEIAQTQWSVRDDIGQNAKFPNTDGCGLISPELCDHINKSLAPLGFATNSRAFQIRFGGVKGVVYAGAPSLIGNPNLGMLLRKSQVKIQVPASSRPTLRVVSTAGDGRASLFIPSGLKAFEDSGADTAAIVKIYEDAYTHLTNITPEGLGILWQILNLPSDAVRTGMESRFVFLRLAIKLAENQIFPAQYSTSFLMLYLRRLAAKCRDKNLYSIPIPASFSLLGLTDDYQVLAPGEVLVRAQGQTRHGRVLIYRDPIIHIGDIQEALAVTDETIAGRMRGMPDPNGRLEALRKMDNVIFFSQADTPPFPNRLSGGDLDGDRFEVLTTDCRFWGDAYRTSDPASYVDDPQPNGHGSGDNPPPQRTIQPFDVQELARFIGQYIRNDCFAELQDRLLALADQKTDGMRNQDVKDLARWLSLAVDYAKSGDGVDLIADVFSKTNFQVARSRPDFLHAVSRKIAAAGSIATTGDYYQSSGLLGQLYRKFSAVEYALPLPANNKSFVAVLAATWSPTIAQLAQQVGADIAGLKDQITRSAWLEIDRSHKSKQYGFGTTVEVDMYLRKQPDDFPFDFIQTILAMISALLRQRNIVAPVDGQPGKFQCAGKYQGNLGVVQNIYKACLYWIWEYSISHFSYPEDLGQSYPFICLYALYCETMPVIR